ncbi:hypothetical protein M8J76_003159 [Diaphorina citri]|nr:hypothetical protein M8J76_003159 [Diaphorina citri]
MSAHKSKPRVVRVPLKFQESCEVSQCCLFAKVTACIDNVCKCKHNKDQTEFSACWNSARQSLGTQNILSFAKLILGAILALSLAALFGILRQLCNRPEVIESSAFQRSFPYESFNSIQRYVMQKLKDRPPRYEDIQKECGGSPSPSSSQGGAAGPRSGRGAPSNLPPSYQGYSAPSSSMDVDLSIPPPPYTPSDFYPSDGYIPTEPYTSTASYEPSAPHSSVETSPLVNKTYLQGQSNPGYQSTETTSTPVSTVGTVQLPSNSPSSSPASTLPAITPKLPSYSQLELLLSPKAMNDHYMSLEQQQSSSADPDMEKRDVKEYQIGDNMMIVSRVIDSENLNVVDGKLSSSVQGFQSNQTTSEVNQTSTSEVNQTTSDVNQTSTSGVNQTTSEVNQTTSEVDQTNISEVNQTSTCEVNQATSEVNQTTSGVNQTSTSEVNQTNISEVLKCVSVEEPDHDLIKDIGMPNACREDVDMPKACLVNTMGSIDVDNDVIDKVSSTSIDAAKVQNQLGIDNAVAIEDLKNSEEVKRANLLEEVKLANPIESEHEKHDKFEIITDTSGETCQVPRDGGNR